VDIFGRPEWLSALPQVLQSPEPLTYKLPMSYSSSVKKVYNLLGGKCRDKIRTYTYLFDLESEGSLLDATEDWTKSPAKLASIAAKRVEEGFTAVKLDPIRQALPGTFPIAPWEIIKEPFEWEDGFLIVPERPGIGIELDEQKLEKHRGSIAELLLALRS